MKMKKVLVGAFLGMFALAGVAVLPNYANAQSGSESDDYRANPTANKQMIGDQELTGSSLLQTVKNAINWILGILATIALVICLYGGFKMITASGDEKKYGDGLKVLKQAAIGLAIVGLSWMIVSIIFWFVGTLGGGKQTQSGGVSNSSSNGSFTEVGD